MALTATKLLRGYHPLVRIKTEIIEGVAQGVGIFILGEYQHTLAGFTVLGKRGLSSEKVAEMVVKDFVKFHQTKRSIDQHLADQLLLPLALSTQASEYQVEKITQHLLTNIWVIEQFELAKIEVNSQENIIKVMAGERILSKI